MKKIEKAKKSRDVADSFHEICHGKEADVVIMGLSIFLLEIYLNQTKENVSIEEFTGSLARSINFLYLVMQKNKSTFINNNEDNQ